MPLSNAPESNFLDFGVTGNIPAASGASVEVENSGGFPTITFDLQVPTGGQVIFEGFIGFRWTPITLRGITTDGYVNKFLSGEDQSFTGSLAGIRKFRVRNLIAGSAPGSIVGRFQRELSTLEGIEHGNPPHKFGYAPKSVDKLYSSTVTGDVLIPAPPVGFINVITELVMHAWGASDVMVTVFDDVNQDGNRLFKGNMDLVINNPIFARRDFGGKGRVQKTEAKAVKVTTDANVNVWISMDYYVAEV